MILNYILFFMLVSSTPTCRDRYFCTPSRCLATILDFQEKTCETKECKKIKEDIDNFFPEGISKTEIECDGNKECEKICLRIKCEKGISKECIGWERREEACKKLKREL